jgi:hypothetical protein
MMGCMTNTLYCKVTHAKFDFSGVMAPTSARPSIHYAKEIGKRGFGVLAPTPNC